VRECRKVSKFVDFAFLERVKYFGEISIFAYSSQFMRACHAFIHFLLENQVRRFPSYLFFELVIIPPMVL